MFKKTVMAFLVLLGALVLGATPVQALGTPQIVSVNPPSGSPVGSNVCIRVKINWDDEYRAMRIRFGNEGWQESSEVEFERCFGTGHLSAGGYTIRVEADRKDGNWSSPAVAEQGYQLTGGSAPPTNTPVPQTPYGPSISDVSFNPPGGTQVGNNVGIHIKVDSSNPGAIRIYIPCGSVDHFEHTVPEYNTTWHTSGCGTGNQTVRVCARHVNDPDWAYANCTERSYNLTAPPEPAKEPTAEFWADAYTIQKGECTSLHWTTSGATQVDIDGTVVSASGDMQVCPEVTKHYSLKAVGSGGEATRSLSIVVQSPAGPSATKSVDVASHFQTGDVIQIGYPVFVIVDGQRRQVPNPETLDALGITRSWINNKGFSDEQLLTIPPGPDIPDVNRDPAGFAAFKQKYFPNTAPIGGSTPTVKPGSSGGAGTTNTPTVTPTSAPSIDDSSANSGDGYDPGVGDPCDASGIEVCAGEPAQDLFTPGQCTWFVAGKRPDVALWIGPRPRHAYLWDDRARARGVPVGSTPHVGDIAVWGPGCAGTTTGSCQSPDFEGCGHVAYVTWVSSDGQTFRVEEANWNRSNPDIRVSSCMSFISRPPAEWYGSQPDGQSEDPSIWDRIVKAWNDFWDWVFGG